MVELLVVAAILCMLAAISFPAFQGLRAKSKALKCTSNLRQIGVAVHLYLAEHNGVFPPAVDYIPWRGSGRVEQAPDDLAFMLNDYLGKADGTHKNNMSSPVWTCPSATKYGSRGLGSPQPYTLGKLTMPTSWGYKYDITYRWNSKTTRGINSMWLNVNDMSAHPQYLSRIRTPGHAALLWDMPDNLAFFPGNGGSPHLHGDGLNCLFVDGHVDRVPVVLDGGGNGVAAAGTLWWFIGEWSYQGWAGAHVPGSDQ